MAYTSQGLANYCVEALEKPTVYLYGGLFRILTTDYIKQKVKQYPNNFNADRILQLKNKIGEFYGCDCVGLIKSYYFGGVGSPNYNASNDWNTNMFFNKATEKGPIATLPNQPGIILYMQGHVGVYIGGENVIECTWGQFGDGVVKTKLSERGWTHWLKIPQIVYEPPICHTNCPFCKQGYYYHTVKSGESYWSIAYKCLGDGERYMEICELNNKKPTDIIYAGEQLKIPIKGDY